MKDSFRLETQGVYRIVVQGVMDDSMSDELSGLDVSVWRSEDEPPVTVLTGRLMDQAALSGVMNTLYNMHYPVLSVELLNKLTDLKDNKKDC